MSRSSVGTIWWYFERKRGSTLRTTLEVRMARSLVQSFRRASRSPTVQVTGSANALSRWEGASPLGGVWGGVAKDRARNRYFWVEGWKKSEKVPKGSKKFEKIQKRSASLLETCFRSRFFIDFGEVLGGFWESKMVSKCVFLLVWGVCFFTR